jgi:hypothetical protein
VACRGRFDADAFSSQTLSRVELFRSRVEATYDPPHWGGLKVRASWSPTASGEGIDLQIQVSATSVNELKSLEVLVSSRFLELLDPMANLPSSWVQPRDARTAALSYDGRVPSAVLSHLTTLPLHRIDQHPFQPVATASPWPRHPWCYLEMVHPVDVSRRISVGKKPGKLRAKAGPEISYALFGHDLEKGVILRGRLRGIWVEADSLGMLWRRFYRDFQDTPPPLAT